MCFQLATSSRRLVRRLCLRLVLLKTKQSSVVCPALKHLRTFLHRARAPSPVVKENTHLSSWDASQDVLHRSGHNQVRNGWSQAVTLRHRAFHKLRLWEHFAVPRQEASLTAPKSVDSLHELRRKPVPGQSSARPVRRNKVKSFSEVQSAHEVFRGKI